jgi:hypothetical protein
MSKTSKEKEYKKWV